MHTPFWYRSLSLTGLLGLSLSACAEHPVTPLTESFDRWHVEDSQPLGSNRVDVLWVVDNSSSMLDEQAQLGEEFTAFVGALSALGADVNLAAVSTDISEGGAFRRGPGDVIAKGCFSPPDDLAACGQRDPVLRTNDYKVNPADPASAIDAVRLAADFRCLGQTGDCGEPIEMGLDAVRLALSPDNLVGQNQNFLRDDAYLVVIFLSDEDDCSQNGASTSGGDAACYSSSRNLPDVQIYLDALVRAKTRPGEDTSIEDVLNQVSRRIFVAGIIGPTDVGPDGVPTPLPANGADHPLACTDSFTEGSGASAVTRFASAYEGRRYRELIAKVGDQGVEQNICAGEYATALTQIGDVIGRSLNLRCLEEPPLTCSSDADCPAEETCINPGNVLVAPKVCSGFEVSVSLKNPDQATFTELVAAGSAGSAAGITATSQYVVDYDAERCPNGVGFRFVTPASVSDEDRSKVIPAPGAVYRASYPVQAAPSEQ